MVTNNKTERVIWAFFLLDLLLVLCILEASGESTCSSKVRFHLIRHGESDANKRGVFAGQHDSLLTEDGRKEARALGRTLAIQETSFWRLYSSDLSRAHLTALEVLKAAAREDTIARLQLDKRLRERSYGPRQGMSRKISVEDALKVWQERNEEPPAWETDENLWERSRQWILDLLKEIKTLERLLESVQIKPPEVYNVFVASHAGIVRVILLNLIGHDRLVELGAKWDASRYVNIFLCRFDSLLFVLTITHSSRFIYTRNNRLVIPNTSLSILELDTGNDRPLENVKVIELTNAKHLGTVNVYDD